MKRGDSFGEPSALNDLPNPFTVEAHSKEVHLYKILRGHFITYFGGDLGDPALHMRAQIVLKANWLKGKVEFIREMLQNAAENECLPEALEMLAFRNEEEIAKLKPTKSNPKEVPFKKNNPRAYDVDPSAAKGEASSGPTLQEMAKAQRQREIEALKASLTAPF